MTALPAGDASLVLQEQPQRAAMDRQRVQRRRRRDRVACEAVDRGQRVVEDVLVVDRVELAVRDERPEVGRLDDGDAVRPQDDAIPATKSLMSGTWAITLLACTTDRPSGRSAASWRPRRPEK